MRKPQATHGGVGGVVLVVCLAIFGAGLMFDFVAAPAPAFWIGAATGGGAAIGVAAAVFAVGAIHLARLLLRARGKAGSGDHVGPDA